MCRILFRVQDTFFGDGRGVGGGVYVRMWLCVCVDVCVRVLMCVFVYLRVCLYVCACGRGLFIPTDFGPPPWTILGPEKLLFFP